MDFKTEMDAYAEAAHDLVTMRAKFRADKEEQGLLEAKLWNEVLKDETLTNERLRKIAFEKASLDYTEYQDLLGAIQLQHDAIANREVDEQFHLMWARYLTAVESSK